MKHGNTFYIICIALCCLIGSNAYGYGWSENMSQTYSWNNDQSIKRRNDPAKTKPPVAVANQPNILWITMEDTSPHFIGCYGNKDAKTPNIDRLAEEGVRFTNAFANAPVCSSARSTIITGAVNETLGLGNHRSSYPLPGYVKGFPTFLKEQGWHTSNNVKTDYCTADSKRIVKESWSESSNHAGWWNRKADQPFFSIFNHTQSHQSYTMTNPYRWYQENVIDHLEEERIVRDDEFEMPPYFRDSPEMRKYFARVYNSVSLADKNIGLLLDSLRRDGLLEETIIFFYADHGEAIPRGKSGSVGIGYKVPFIVWFLEKYKHLSPWKTGGVTDELICFDDLGPTVLSMAGIKAPDYMTGRPFLGKFRGKPRPYVFTSRNRIDETPGLTRSITDGRYMFTKVFTPQFPELEFQKYADVSDIVQLIRKDNREGVLNPVQSEMLEKRTTSDYLYDLESDPWKLHNLAQDDEYAGRVKKMKGKLYKNILEMRDAMFAPEYELDRISMSSTPFEFRQTRAYRLPAILKAAEPVAAESAGRTLKKLETDNHYALYWTLMGLVGVDCNDARLQNKLTSLMDHEFIPVQVLASMISFDQFKDQKGGRKVKSFIASENPLIALQAAQLIQYTPGAPAHFQKELQDLVNLKKDQKDFLNPVSAAETMLFYLKGEPLYYDHMKSWMDIGDSGELINEQIRIQ